MLGQQESSAVDECGLPSGIRTDKSIEIVVIAGYIISKRGANRGSAIVGKTTYIKGLNACGVMFLRVF